MARASAAAAPRSNCSSPGAVARRRGDHDERRLARGARRRGRHRAAARLELRPASRSSSRSRRIRSPGGRELLLGLEVDLGGVRGRDLEVARAGARRTQRRPPRLVVVRERERGVPQHALADVERLHELGDRHALRARRAACGRTNSRSSRVTSRSEPRLSRLARRWASDVRADVAAQLLVGVAVGGDLGEDPLGGLVGQLVQALLRAPRGARRSQGPGSRPSLSSPAIVCSTQRQRRT